VTRDKDLLDLMDQTTEAGTDFRQRFPGLTILDPEAFLRQFLPEKTEEECLPSEEGPS
jgi:hypothetical protein